MAFNKFDPHAPESDRPENTVAQRRAMLLKWGWLITMVYTVMGFGFLAVFAIWGNPF